MAVRAGKFAVFVVAGLVLAGCSDKTGGTPFPGVTSASSAASTSAGSSSSANGLPAAGAPAVENPLTDTQKFQDDPCSMLTAAQLSQLSDGKALQGEKSQGSAGPQCRWYNPDTSGSINIQWFEATKRGLTALYEANAKGSLAFFEPKPAIDGKPAVAYDTEDERSLGSCAVAVGVTDELSFEVSIGVARDKRGSVEPCQAAYGVAETMLATLQGR